jgi:hypothetical protein
MNQYVNNEKALNFKFTGIGLQVAVFMHLIYTTFYDFTMFFWILLGIGSIMIMSHNKDVMG